MLTETRLIKDRTVRRVLRLLRGSCFRRLRSTSCGPVPVKVTVILDTIEIWCPAASVAVTEIYSFVSDVCCDDFESREHMVDAETATVIRHVL